MPMPMPSSPLPFSESTQKGTLKMVIRRSAAISPTTATIPTKSASFAGRPIPFRHCSLLLLFLLVLLLVATFDTLQPAEAMSTWRMRTDKKAMRNSLVRFGKRAYRPAGEAFVSAVDLADGTALMDGREPNVFRAFYSPRYASGGLLADQTTRNGGGGGWRE